MKQGESYTVGKERTSVRPRKFQLNQYVLNIKKRSRCPLQLLTRKRNTISFLK